MGKYDQMWKINWRISFYSSPKANNAVLHQGSRLQHFGLSSVRLSSTYLSCPIPPPTFLKRNQNHMTFSQPDHSSTFTLRSSCVPLPCKSIQKRQIHIPKASKRSRYVLGTLLIGTPLLVYYGGFGLLLKICLFGAGAVATFIVGVKALSTYKFRPLFMECITLIKSKERMIIHEVGQPPLYPNFSLKLFTHIPVQNNSKKLFIFRFPLGITKVNGEIISLATYMKNNWMIMGVVLNYVDASGSKKKVTLFTGDGKTDPPEFTTIDATAQSVKNE